jgi:hypothetical protein
MRSQTSSRALAGIALLAVLVCASAARAQDSPAHPQQSPSPPAPAQPSAPSATMNIAHACVQPPPMVRLEDYDGPFRKTVALFDRKIELTAVRQPHYQPGVKLCSLHVQDKFVLFVRDTIDPVTFLDVAFDAGFDQATNRDPTFGQGAAGYGKRFGASFADQTSFKFFKDFAYPSIFSEDPRYYRLIEGSTGRRILHAVDHAFVAHRDNGDRMFNFSEWLGTISVLSLSNLYRPGNQRGFGPTSEQVGYNIGEDMCFDVLREFWPQIAHKFRLPFRDEPALPYSVPNPAGS